MLDEEKLQFLIWCPSGLTPWQIWWSLSACETGSWLPFSRAIRDQITAKKN